MTNIDLAAEILDARHRYDQLRGDGVIGCFDARKAAQALADAGLLTPDPQVIRTVAELEALDPDALLVARQDGWEVGIPMTATEWLDDWQIDPDVIFPLAVITPAAQVRAARKALEEA